MEVKVTLGLIPHWSIIEQKAWDPDFGQWGKLFYSRGSQVYTEDLDKVIWESLYTADSALKVHIQEDMQ